MLIYEKEGPTEVLMKEQKIGGLENGLAQR
jgi:hypothetical protein